MWIVNSKGTQVVKATNVQVVDNVIMANNISLNVFDNEESALNCFNEILGAMGKGVNIFHLSLYNKKSKSEEIANDIVESIINGHVK